MSEEITLRDIEVMVQILEKYLKLSRKVERILSQYVRTQRMEGDIIKMLLSSVAPRSVVSEVESIELSEEEKRVIEKIKGLSSKGGEPKT